jgi:hypothetical protein
MHLPLLHDEALVLGKFVEAAGTEPVRDFLVDAGAACSA